jgi:hypothetical protein
MVQPKRDLQQRPSSELSESSESELDIIKLPNELGRTLWGHVIQRLVRCKFRREGRRKIVIRTNERRNTHTTLIP